MSLLSMLFGSKPKTAALAKERLQLIIAREHGSPDAPDYLPELQKEQDKATAHRAMEEQAMAAAEAHPDVGHRNLVPSSQGPPLWTT